MRTFQTLTCWWRGTTAHGIPPQGGLERVRPELAVISAGKGNSYGHPAPETLERLDGVGALIYRTDLQGTVVVRADGQAPAEG